MRSTIDSSLCAVCCSCLANCPNRAIARRGAGLYVSALCTGCGQCRQYCPTGAMGKGTEEIDFDNRRVGAALVEKLSLKRPIVAMKYASKPPDGVPVEPGPTFWCAISGEVFAGESGPVYFAREASLCGGAAMLGLGARQGVSKEEMCESLEAAEVIGEGNHYATMHDMARARDAFPAAPRTHNGIVIGPLDRVPMPDMILMAATGHQLCVISTAYTFDTGNVIHGAVGSAACVVTASSALYANRPVFTSGDHGARMFMKLGDEEILIGFPYKIVPGLIKNLDRTIYAREGR